MKKRMLINTSNVAKTEIAITYNERLQEYDFEFNKYRNICGNIYLGRVTRVESSLQAVFIDYGRDQHGFLAFSEINLDYYRIPVDDIDSLEFECLTFDIVNYNLMTNVSEGYNITSDLIVKRYKVEDVIEKNQIILIQVITEERDIKGAVLTTYISIAGRYCILMPNAKNNGGISRKISNSKTRKKLKLILNSINIPGKMSLILRTAGAKHSKIAIERDSNYLVRTWHVIRKFALF